MTTMRNAMLLVAALATLCPVAAVAADDAAPGRIATVTRQVKLFAELEAALATSLQGGDAAAAEKLVAEDFELRVGSIPGHPTPRAEWLRQSLARPAPPSGIEQMAVHDYGDVAVVSFLQAAMKGGRRHPAGDIFAVDVWKRAADSWQLAVRYAGPSGSRGFAIPGAATAPAIDKRY